MSIIIIEQKHIEQDDLRSLYEDVEWYAYTKDLNQLQRALIQSLNVVSAWDNRKLIGLTRSVGDGLTIVYVQDILVLKEYQNQGLASIMMQYVLEKYKDVRQKVLLTEEAPDLRHFYEKNGFQSCDKGTLVAFAKLD